jgi:hypothetical protein
MIHFGDSMWQLKNNKNEHMKSPRAAAPVRTPWPGGHPPRMIILGIPCPPGQAGIWQNKTAGFSLRTRNEHMKLASFATLLAFALLFACSIQDQTSTPATYPAIGSAFGAAINPAKPDEYANQPRPP